MIPYYIYNHDGEILRTGICPEGMLALQMGIDEFADIGIADDMTQYVDMDTHQKAYKQPIASVFSKMELAADDSDMITISSLPIPCSVALDDVVYEVPDGELQFTVDMPGEYRVRISALNMLDHETTVTAV